MLKIVRTPKSPCWYIRGSIKGQRVFESTGTGDKQQALARLQKRWAELYNQHALGRPRETLFEEAVNSFLDAGGSPKFVAPLLRRWGGLPISMLTQPEVDRAANELYPNAVTATKVRQVYAPTRAILRHALRAGLEGVPLRPLVVPKHTTPPAEWVTDDYLAQLLPHCAPPLKAAILVMTFTGLRSGELLRLEPDAFQRKPGWAFIPRTKNGTPAMVPLPEQAREAGEAIGWVFPWSAPPALCKALRRACKRAGLPYRTPHEVGRHSFAARLLNAGVGIKVVAAAGRWKSLAVLDKHYGHLAESHAHEVMLSVSGGKLVDVPAKKSNED